MMRHSNATLGIRLLLLIIIASFLVGCQQVDRKYDKAYFDFDSLVNIQVKKISLTGDSIHKAASMDGKADESIFLADSSALAHELDVFRQLDVINKPLYKEAYKITSEKDAKSNLIGGFPLRIDSNRGILDYLSLIGFYQLPLTYLDDYTKQVDKVTLNDIKSAFKRRIDPEKLVTVIVGTPN